MRTLTGGDKERVRLILTRMCVNKLKIGHKKIIILRLVPKQTSDIKLIKAMDGPKKGERPRPRSTIKTAKLAQEACEGGS